MSSPSSPQHEPTMEEILASIRKIISEDQAEPAVAPAPTAASRPVPVASVATMEEEEEPVEADVLELTHEVRDETPAPEPEAEPEPEPEMTAEDMAGSEVAAADEVTFETVEETQEQEEEPAMAANELISDNARRAMNKAFEPFDRKAEAAAPAMPTIEGVHVEAIFTRAIQQSFNPVLQDWVSKHSDDVVAHMKPIIREWMDDNLPDLIEKAVKSEIAAAVRTLTKKR